MGDVNTVTLSITEFSNIKTERCKQQMVIDRLISTSTLSEDRESLEFNSADISQILSFVYPELYKKRLATLRTLDTKSKTEAKVAKKKGPAKQSTNKTEGC